MAITTLEKVKLVLGPEVTEGKDDLITALIPIVEEDYLAIRNKPFDLTTDDPPAIIYPAGAEMTAIQMIGYRISVQGKIGGDSITSERLGDYSVTYDNEGKIKGYPQSIVGNIKRYVSFI